MASVAKLKDLVDALVSCRRESNRSFAECVSGLEKFFKQVEASPFLKKAARSPVASLEEKTAVVQDVCSALELPEDLRNFLVASAEFGKLGALLSRSGEVLDRLRSAGGIMQAKVTASRPVGEDDRRRISETLSRLVDGKTLEVEFTEDSEIIDGIVVRLGNSIYDDSVKTRLAKMRAALLK